jgi:hypothetical protein
VKFRFPEADIHHRVLTTQNGLMSFGPCHGGLVILKLPVEFSNQAA